MELTSKEIKKVKQGLRSRVRDIEKYLPYIEKHGVYGSMTSSPDRLLKSSITISIILLNPYIKAMYINLPLKFRNKKSYRKRDVEKVQKLDPRIKIRWLKEDIGPITKILPSLQSVRDKKAIIISFDDDIFYPPALINELIYYSIRYPNLIVGGAGFNFGTLEDFIKRVNWPEKRKPRYPNVDIIEGWGAIAYRKELVDLNLIKKLNKQSVTCKLSDDLTLSYSFAQNGVRRRLIDNQYYSANADVFSFSFSNISALHSGSGTEYTETGDINMLKYRDCLTHIST